jgi:hypothetical protein
LEFDPSHEQLELHHIRVWRGGSCVEIDLLGTSGFQLLRREKQLERLALNGRLSATFLIPDVRVDDRVEVSSTRYSNNPVLAGRYVGWTFFNSYAPWVETRHRLLRPLARTLYMKAFNDPPEPVSEKTGEMEGIALVPRSSGPTRSRGIAPALDYQDPVLPDHGIPELA